MPGEGMAMVVTLTPWVVLAAGVVLPSVRGAALLHAQSPCPQGSSLYDSHCVCDAGLTCRDPNNGSRHACSVGHQRSHPALGELHGFNPVGCSRCTCELPEASKAASESKRRSLSSGITPIYFCMYDPARFSLFMACDRVQSGTVQHTMAALQFLARIRNHRWRVRDLNDPRIMVAVIPVLLDHYVQHLCGEVGDEHLAAHLTNASAVVRATYERWPHMLFTHDWRSTLLWAPGTMADKAFPGVRRAVYNMCPDHASPRPETPCEERPCVFGVPFAMTIETGTVAMQHKREQPDLGLADFDELPLDRVLGNSSEHNNVRQGLYLNTHGPRKCHVAFVGQADRRPGHVDRMRLFDWPTRVTKRSVIALSVNSDQMGGNPFAGWTGKLNTTTQLYPHEKPRSGSSTGTPPCPPFAFPDCNTSHPMGLMYCTLAGSRTIQMSKLKTTSLTARSTFVLHLRGDDVGSDRLCNALTGLSIPVVIQPEGVPLADVTSWLPFHFAIPWDDILVVVPQDEFAADPGGAIMRHTDLAEAEIEHRRRLIGGHLPDILHDVPASRVAENMLRAASLAKC